MYPFQVRFSELTGLQIMLDLSSLLQSFIGFLNSHFVRPVDTPYSFSTVCLLILLIYIL